MSRYQDSFELPLSLEGAVRVMSASLGGLIAHPAGWTTLAPAVATLVCQEPPQMLSFTNPAQLTITVAGAAAGCVVTLDASNTGFGPLQNKHVRSVVEAVRENALANARHVSAKPYEGDEDVTDALDPEDGALPEPIASPLQGGGSTPSSSSGAGSPDPPTDPAASHEGAPAPEETVPAGRGDRGRASSSEESGSSKSEEAGDPHPRDDHVFVSYRRDDTGYVTDQICDRLVAELGSEAVFKDIDSIPLGVNFKTHLQGAVEQCDVLLAIIGRDWLEPGSDGATPRLHEERDFVRIELEAAIVRGVPIIPVLVRDAKLPGEGSLPDSLKELPYFNGIRVRRGDDFERDVERLIDSLTQILEGSSP